MTRRPGAPCFPPLLGSRTLQALNEGLGETQAAIEKLRRDIESGAVSVKPVFPVVSADPASPKEGEAWVLGGRPDR